MFKSRFRGRLTRLRSFTQSVPRGTIDILGGPSIGDSKQKIAYVSYSERFRTVQYAVHCTDAHNAMSSHVFQGALMLTVEFSTIHYTR
jgi:hypothetical protein